MNCNIHKKKPLTMLWSNDHHFCVVCDKCGHIGYTDDDEYEYI